MDRQNSRRVRLLLFALMIISALVLSACSDDTEGEIDQAQAEATQEALQAADNAIAEQTEEALQAQAEMTAEAQEAGVGEGTPEAEAEDSETIVQSQLITDTEVLTATEVITQAVVTEVITETTIITDVITQEETIVDSDVMTETADLGTEASPVRVRGADSDTESEQGYVILVLEEETGRRVLSDTNQQPIYAYEGEGILQDDNFQPITAEDDVSVSADVDSSLFTAENRDGVNVILFNERPLYRFVGESMQEADQMARDLGLSQVNPEGDLEEFE